MPDEFGGIEATEVETDEFGGTIVHPPTDQKWEKPLPLGQRLIDKYARPTFQGLGSAAGIILGGGTGGAAGTAVVPGPGTATGAMVGAVAGESLGYAIGDEIADLMQEWMGYYEPLPLLMNLQEAAENVGEGATYATGGYSAVPAAKLAGKGISKIPGVGRMGKWIGSMLPKTDKRAQQAAGEILAAVTDKGPMVSKNIEEAKALEELIGGGFKFDLGQLTGDVNVVKFMREGVDDVGDLAVARAEQSAINTRAINDFIKRTKGKGTTKDFTKPLSAKEGSITEAEEIAKRNLEKQQAAKASQTKPMDIGTTIRGEMEAGETAARKKASEMFDKVPNQTQIVDDLYDEFNKIMKPKYRSEGRDKFPDVLKREIKAIEGSLKKGSKSAKRDATSQAVDIADSGKYSSAQAYAKHSVFVKKAAKLTKEGKFDEAMKVSTEGQTWREAAEIMEGTWKGDPTKARQTRAVLSEPTMTLRDIQGLRSEILEDLRTAKDKGLPRSLRARLAKAVEVIDQKLGGGPSKTEDIKSINRITAVKAKGKVYKASGTRFEIDLGPAMGMDTRGQVHAEIIDDAIKAASKKGIKLDYDDFETGFIDKKTGRYASSDELMAIQKKITPSQELQAAQKFFREEVIEKYGKGSIGAVLRGEDAVQSAAVAGKFFKSGPIGEQAAEEFIKVMGNNPAAKTALREHINQSMLDKAVSPSTDEVTKAALNRWLKSHRWALKKLGMTSEFDTLVKARAVVNEAIASSKEFEKSAASRVLNADVNDIVKQAFSKGSKKEAAEKLIAFMKRPKPSRDELLYHATDATIPPEETLKSGYFGGRYHLEEEMIEPYGANLYALKLPKRTKTLNLWDGSKDSRDFMKEFLDSNPMTKKEYEEASEIFGYGGPYEILEKAIKTGGDEEAADTFVTWFMDTGTIQQKLKLAKEKGYDVIEYQDEFLVPESLIKKSQAFNAKTHKPVTGKQKPVKTADLYKKTGEIENIFKGKSYKIDEYGAIKTPKGDYTDPKALAGLQNAMVDEILTEIPLEGKVSELLTSSKMASQFRKYDAALKVVFKDSPEKLKAMHVVRRAVKALEYKTGQKSGEGVEYATNVITRMSLIYGHSMAAATDIAKKTVKVLKGMSKEKIHKYINRGILDPETAFSLIQAARGGSEKRIVQGVTNSLLRLNLLAQPKKKEVKQPFTGKKGKH